MYVYLLYVFIMITMFNRYVFFGVSITKISIFLHMM